MDIKRKTCGIQTWGKETFISRHILHQHWDTCPISLPMRRNPKHRSLLTVVSANSAPPFRHLLISKVHERISRPSREPLYATNTSRRKQETLLGKYPLHWVLCPPPPKNRQKCTLAFGILHLEDDRHFDSWNQPLNTLPRCHEAGLCCYLVIYIENLGHPLQLFYFHSWPIHGLSIVASI
jgi:hypothetical protein